MAGFLTVIGRISGDLNRGNDATYTARIGEAIREAIYFYRAVRLGWNTKRKTFLVSSEYASFTANWIETDAISLERPSYRNRLTEKPWLWIEDRRTNPTSYRSEPQIFAVQNRQLRFYPSPDQSYSVIMSYHYDLVAGITSLSDSFSTTWLTEGEQLIRMHAAVDVLENYIEGDEAYAKAARLRLREEAELKMLKRRANREQSTGMITPFL